MLDKRFLAPHMKIIKTLLFILLSLLPYILCQYGIAAQIMLAWDPPTTNADGSPLTDLAGYKVYYGTSCRTYGSSIDVGNVTSYTLDLPDLTEGQTYSIAVRAYDQDNPANESDYSNEVTWPIIISTFLMEASTGGNIASQIAGIPFGIRITALDACNNTVTSFNGTVQITSKGVLSALR